MLQEKFMLSASCGNGLIRQLRGVDIGVPPRMENGRTREREIHAFCFVLATMAESGILGFPLMCWRRDDVCKSRSFPDFELLHGGVRCGVEVTEMVPPNYADAEKWRELKYPDEHLDLFHPLFAWGATPLPGIEEEKFEYFEKLKAELFNVSGSRGTDGTELEEEFARAVLDVVQRKTTKFSTWKANDAYAEVWLVVYENLPAGFIRHLSELQSRLKAEIEGYMSGSGRHFDRVFIHTASYLVGMSAQGWLQLPIRDLWTQHEEVEVCVSEIEETIKEVAERHLSPERRGPFVKEIMDQLHSLSARDGETP